MSHRRRAVLVVSGVLLLVTEAAAEAPACFPERTVMWKSPLTTSDGRTIGGLRAGYPLKVLADRVADASEHSEIETTEPVRFRARVERSSLVVFARKDIELIAGWKWLRADSALRIVEGDGAAVQVALANPRCDESPSSSFGVQCSDLIGTPPRNIQRDSCHGAIVAGGLSGKPVHWPEVDRVVKSEDGSHQELLAKANPAWLVRREKDRALVDILGADRHLGRVRYRGWAEATGMVERSPSFTIGLCCEGMLSYRALDEPTRLAASVVLREYPELAETKVPRVIDVRLVSRFRDAEIPTGHVRPGWFWPPSGEESFVLLGPVLKMP